MKTYTITVTEKQAAEIKHACEILARLRIGQIDDAFRELPLASPDSVEVLADIERQLRSMYRSPIGRVSCSAWDLYQVIRHRLAWDNFGPSFTKPYGVSFDEPMQFGPEPLARIEEVKP